MIHLYWYVFFLVKWIQTDWNLHLQLLLRLWREAVNKHWLISQSDTHSLSAGMAQTLSQFSGSFQDHLHPMSCSSTFKATALRSTVCFDIPLVSGKEDEHCALCFLSCFFSSLRYCCCVFARAWFAAHTHNNLCLLKAKFTALGVYRTGLGDVRKEGTSVRL